MVFLNYTIMVKAPLPKVWNYFSRFQTVCEWDPNVKSAYIGKQTKNLIGTQYNLVTIWKGKESDIVYELKEYKQNQMIKVVGKNAMITATDVIKFKEKGQHTEVTYQADICLNHIFVLATPFIKSDLNVLCEEARKGMQAKSAELFGN